MRPWGGPRKPERTHETKKKKEKEAHFDRRGNQESGRQKTKIVQWGVLIHDIQNFFKNTRPTGSVYKTLPLILDPGSAHLY